MLDLAEKQLDEAEQLDPTVKAVKEVENGVIEHEIKTLRSSIILNRGLAIGFGKADAATGARYLEQRAVSSSKCNTLIIE